MITPNFIEINNFLSYVGTHKLSFQENSYYLVSGKNGAGKSALADTMIFSLFGILRSEYSPFNNQILSFGAESGYIQFDFFLNDTLWRIRRDFSTDSTNNHIQFKKRQNTYWKNYTLSEDSLTQQQILDTLKITPQQFFMTFFKTNSYPSFYEFLSLNNVDKYTAVSRFLNVPSFDLIQKFVEKDLQEYAIRKEYLSTFINQNKSKIKEKKQLEKILHESKDKLAKTKEQILHLKQDIDQQDLLCKEIENGLQNKKILMERIQYLRNNQNEKRTERQLLSEKLNELQNAIKIQHEIENGYKQLSDLIVLNKKYNENFEQRERIQHQIDEIQTILDDQEIALKKKANDLKQAEDEYSEKKKYLPDLNLKMQAIQSKLKEMEKVRYQVQKLEKEKESIQKEIDVLNEKIGMLKKERIIIREKKEKIYKEVVSFEQIIQKDQSTKKKLQILKENKEKVKLLQDQIDLEEKKKNILSQQNERFESMIETLNEKISIFHITDEFENRCPACGTPLTKEKESEILLNYKRDLEMKKSTLNRNLNTLQKMENKIVSLNSDKNVLSSDFHLEEDLQQQYLQIQECKASIRTKTENHYRTKLQESKIEEELNKTTYSINNLKSRLKTADQQFINLTLVLSNQTVLENNLGDLHKQISEALEVDQKLPSILKQLIETKRKIETKNYSQDNWKKLNELKKRILSIPYSVAEHNQIKNKINQLKYFETEKRVMDEKLIEKDSVLNQLSSVDKKLGSLQSEIDKNIDSIKGIPYQQKDLYAEQDKKKCLVSNREQSELEEKDLEIEISKFEQNMEDIHRLQIKYGEALEEFNTYLKKEKSVTICRELLRETAIGVFIVSRIIPSLEFYVNGILSSLTDNDIQASVSLTKSKNNNQQLTVKIIESGHSISYEYLSTAEKFKVNIAFRLAFSKLLSDHPENNRVFLCIDDDFGSLDLNSKNQIILSLLKLKKSINTLLLITHSNVFQNCFDYRIRIQKTRNTSSFSYY